MKRPVSLTILGWLFVICDVANLVFQPWLMTRPTSVAALDQYRVRIGVYILVALTISVCCLVSGVAILKGRGWGRTLYVWISRAGFAFAAVVTPDYLLVTKIPSVLIVAVVVCLLYRRSASAYFNQSKS